MSETSTTERLAVLIGRVCDISSGIIDGQARLLGFGLDSVRITELIVLIEEEFAVVLRMQDLNGVQTVEDLAHRIEDVATSTRSSMRQQVGPAKES